MEIRPGAGVGPVGNVQPLQSTAPTKSAFAPANASGQPIDKLDLNVPTGPLAQILSFNANDPVEKPSAVFASMGITKEGVRLATAQVLAQEILSAIRAS